MTTFGPEDTTAAAGATITTTAGGGADKTQAPPLLMDSGQINRSDLITAVRQMVGSVTSKLSISPTATNGIEEAMAKLEATDENFNR